MNLITLLSLSVFALLNAPEINALKRIKRNSEVRLHNNLKNDFVVLKTEKQNSAHVVGGLKNMDKQDSLNNDMNAKLSKTEILQNMRMALKSQGKEVSPILGNRSDFKTKTQSLRKPAIGQSPAQQSQLIQKLYQTNNDPVLDLIFNSLEGPQALFSNMKNPSSEYDNPYNGPQTHTIIYAPPAMFEQQMAFKQPKQDIEYLMKNALNSILMGETNMNDEEGSVDVRCPIHLEKKRGNNDADVIQFCSCHFIKKSKGDIKDKK